MVANIEPKRGFLHLVVGDATMLRGGSLFVLLLFAGCIGTVPHGDSAQVPAATSEVVAPIPARITLVDRDFKLAPGSYEYDVLCVFGGAFEMPRKPDARITNATRALEFVIEAPPENSGLEIGYAYGKEKTNWLPPVFNEKKTITVALPTGKVDSAHDVWRFFFSQSTPATPSGCYTGISLSSHVTITGLNDPEPNPRTAST